MLAANVGYWDSALSLDQLFEFITRNKQWLSAIGKSKERQDEILLPVYRRVEQYYWNDSRDLVIKALVGRSHDLQAQINRTPAEPPEARNELQRQIDLINRGTQRVQEFTLESFRETPSVTLLIDVLTQCRELVPDAEADVSRVKAIDEDLRFFLKHRTGRPH
jgi:hypothetical protein